MRRLPLALLFTVAAACDGCGSCGSSLRVEGADPYVRCTAMEPEERQWEVGELSFTVEERTLTVEGEASRILAFALSPGADLEPLPEAPLRVVLGGFARDADSAERLLGGLAVAGPSLLLPGGEDDTEVLDEALESVDEPALIDLRGIERVRFGGHEWVVVPGAPEGRYARGESGCGFGTADLEAYDLPDPEGPRHLLSWAAPTGVGPLERGFDRVAVGSGDLAALAERVGAQGALFAWPRTPTAARYGEAPATAIAAPVWGRIVEGPDGSWSRGATAAIELAEGALSLAR